MVAILVSLIEIRTKTVGPYRQIVNWLNCLKHLYAIRYTYSRIWCLDLLRGLERPNCRCLPFVFIIGVVHFGGRRREIHKHKSHCEGIGHEIPASTEISFLCFEVAAGFAPT